MKRLIYIAAAAAVMTACSGVKDFDNFIGELRQQPARIDTISSNASYVQYIDELSALNNSFDELGLELNDEQKQALAGIQDTIQQHIDAKYMQLGSEAVLPSALPAEDANTTEDTTPDTAR